MGENAVATTTSTLTLEEFLKLPEEKPALEYEEGRVTQKVLPKGEHSTLQSALVILFNGFGLARRLARAFPELRYSYVGRAYVPDVSVYRWARIPVTARGRVANDFFEPPDVAVEIVSPEQSTNALIRRCLWYVANGVLIALLVDPGDDSAVRFVAGEPPQVLGGLDAIDLSVVLPGFELTVEQLFETLNMV